MKSLLTALQEGRLVELPDEDKEKALEYLANLIEAIPDIETEQDIYDLVLKREAVANTAIGMGVACPHVVGQQGTEGHCAVGWSPEGIDYGPNGSQRVYLVIMYYIPKSLRNVYLKELSCSPFRSSCIISRSGQIARRRVRYSSRRVCMRGMKSSIVE